ncbi:aminotransferase yhxA [Cytobacillus sp. S13-E01]|uniref:aminotransferase yhxA n=1 Tax=Cytobacillus sp. S13-E01 TaxID=3031326 RepID=UPI0023D8621B|nr:aminotransferase yhxA [Cytobacillus sp. S13-E01]MDF0725602.1 aminotransferase yhxA [Cytobacillus sp. S13-E01]
MTKTKKLLTGIISAAMVTSVAGCNNQQSLPPEPTDEECRDWEWDGEDGVWECDDRNSPRYGHFFYGGMFFASRSLLRSNSSFQNYKSSNSFKGAKSGFGSGSRGGFGG